VDDWKEGILAEDSIDISSKDFEERCDVVEEISFVFCFFFEMGKKR